MDSRPLRSMLLFALLGTALALRLLLAYVILPDSGHPGDLYWYSRWALTLARVGPGEFYAVNPETDYPPGYLYVLWLVGYVSQALASAMGTDVQRLCISLLKLPPMLLDIGAGFLIYRIARYCTTETRTTERTALVAAAVYVFNPVVLYDSVIWGQTDAAGAFVALLGLVSLLKWPPEASASIAVITALVKPQFGVIVTPLIGIVLFRRYCWPGIDSPRLDSKPHGMQSGAPLRILTSFVAATVVFYAIVIPFNLTAEPFFQRMVETARYFHFLSVNALNPWAMVGSGHSPALVFAGLGNWPYDDIPLVGRLTGVTIGAALLMVGFIVGAVRLMLRDDWRSIILVGAYLSLCFFVLPTRVHERYVFLAFAFIPILAAFDRKWLWATLLLTIGSLMNLHAVLTHAILIHPVPRVSVTETLLRIPLSSFLRSPEGMLISIVLQTAVFLFALGSLRPGTLRADAKNSDILTPVDAA